MPMWASYRVTGLLRPSRHDARRLELKVDDGGVWRLDVTILGFPAHLIGARVTVKGLRIGFDLLDVEEIFAAE